MCRTQALINALLEVGSDRILFSTDYPFESMADSSGWLDTVTISELDRKKIGRGNALRAFNRI